MQKLLKGGSLVASIKDMDMKQGIVTGYFASFNTLDSDNDIIMPRAFAKTIQEQGPNSTQPRIKHLLNHNTSQPLGVCTILKEDNSGLYYESKVGTHALGMDFMKMVESGLITEHSIGYGIVKKTVMNPDAHWRDQQTQLHELKLWEGSSLTAWGANQYTPLTGVKCKEYAGNRIELLMKAIDNGTFTDSTFLFLKEELLYLQAAFKSADETTKPDQAGSKDAKPQDTTLPSDEGNNMLKEIALINLRLQCIL